MDYKISVIIPVYNVEEYVAECLDSIVNQTIGIENIEVIIVNDCTPDNSMTIVREYAKKYPSIKIIEHEKNQGLGPTRNTGLKHVNSEYITFIDSDDFISENTYELAINGFIENGCDLYIYKYELFSNSGKKYPLDIHQEIYKTSRVITNITEIPEIIFATSACNKIYPKKFIQFLKFPAMHYEDNVISAEILFNSKKIIISTSSTYFYRQRESETASITKQFSKKNCLDLLQSNMQIHDLLDKYPDYGKLISWINLFFSHIFLIWMLNLDLNLTYLERAKIIMNSNTLLKKISESDINEFNSYFPDYKIKNIKLILDARNKNFLVFLFKYEQYLPLKKRIENIYLFKNIKNKTLLLLKRTVKIFDIIGTILISYIYRIRNRPGYIWLLYENKKHNHRTSNIIEYITENHPEIITFYIINKNDTEYPQNINENNIIKYGSMYHKIYFILSSKLITDKKANIEPWNYGQFNKLFKWSGPKKEYVLLYDEMLAEDIVG